MAAAQYGLLYGIVGLPGFEVVATSSSCSRLELAAALATLMSALGTLSRAGAGGHAALRAACANFGDGFRKSSTWVQIHELATARTVGLHAQTPPERRPFASTAAQPLYESRQAHDPFVRGLLLDVAGTLLSPSEKMTYVYKRLGGRYGVTMPEREMLLRFRHSYNQPWTKSPIRYVGDAKDFWYKIVSDATGCGNYEFFEEVYDYYARKEAWKVAPGAENALRRLRATGVKLAIVSNFDTRLRPLLDDMELTPLFDAVVVSADVSAEKPNPVIFDRAVELLELDPAECVHVGDDRRNDLWGARDAGCHALLWGYDVKDMAGVVDWVMHGEHKIQPH